MLSYYVNEAKKMLAATDDNNEKLYDSTYITNMLYDAGLSTTQAKKVIQEAGGNTSLYEREMEGQLKRMESYSDEELAKLYAEYKKKGMAMLLII